jgi:hypothetical protein
MSSHKNAHLSIRRDSGKDRKDNLGFFVSPYLLLQLNTVHFMLLSVHFMSKYAQTEKQLKSKNKYLFKSISNLRSNQSNR